MKRDALNSRKGEVTMTTVNVKRKRSLEDEKLSGIDHKNFMAGQSFDLSDPARVRALIDMLPEGASMKKELRKLVGDDPIESVSIETFEQTPPIYKGISL